MRGWGEGASPCRGANFSIRSVTTTTSHHQRRRRHRTPPRCPRSNSNKNTNINYYYYLKELSDSFIRQFPSASPSTINNSLLRCALYGDNAEPPNNNYKNFPQHPAVNKCNNNSPVKNYELFEFLTLSDVYGGSSGWYNRERKYAIYGTSPLILHSNRDEAYDFSGNRTTPDRSKKREGPGTPSFSTERTVIGTTEAHP